MSWLAPGIDVSHTFYHLLASIERLYLRDTLSPLSPAQHGPCNTARVLALQEERLALAVLEAEDFAISPDEQLALDMLSASCSIPLMSMSLIDVLHARYSGANISFLGTNCSFR